MPTDLAAVAGLLANPARAAMIDRLMAGTPASAGELARVAGIRASTASSHLAELQSGGLVTAVREGRNKHFTISSREVATALESFSLICPSTEIRSLRQSRESVAMARLRTCYDHLAGAIAVGILDAITRRRWIESDCLTPRGQRALVGLGIDVETARNGSRKFIRECIDVTEKRPHLSGALGAEFAKAFLTNHWAQRRGVGRSLDVTESGATVLCESFGIGPGFDLGRLRA